MTKNTETLHIAISRCLMGDHVRYDGGHRKLELFTQMEQPNVRWYPVCPEVEAGLGIPREPIRLIIDGESLRVREVDREDIDHTAALHDVVERQLSAFRSVSGYVVKARSPSCAYKSLSVESMEKSIDQQAGYFVHHIRQAYPRLPLIEDDDLTDSDAWFAFLHECRQYSALKT